MTDQRLKGQECEVRIVQDGVLSDAFGAISGFDDTLKFEKKEAGYLGEKTNRHDDIYNGVDFKLEMHLQNKRWMLFQQAVKDRAMRVTPGTVFNVIVTDFYPNGESATRIYSDAKWGPMPKSIPSRGDYVSVSLDGSCDDCVDDTGSSIL